MPTNVEIPAFGESITEAVLIKWLKADGQVVAANEPLCELETDKANVDLPSPGAGVLRRATDEGQTVHVGETIGRIDDSPAALASAKSGPAVGAATPVSAGRSAVPAGTTGASAKPAAASSAPTPVRTAPPSPASAVPPVPSDQSPSVRRLAAESGVDPAVVGGTGRDGRVTKQDMQQAIDKAPPPPVNAATPGGDGAADAEDDGEPAPPAKRPVSAPVQPAAPATPARPQAEKLIFDAAGTKRVPMSKMRKKIAQRLIAVQQTAAILTTFNEVDLTAILAIRGKYKQRFIDIHGISLGLMSFFCRASVLALAEFPRVNASIDGDDIVYHQHVHLGIAVSTERGLAVPVLRNAETLSFAKIEAEVKRLAASTRDGKLSMEELSGGTFTITNGGVFGSLLSTPILNPPQSGILGMHAIQKRPMVVDGKIEARDMMYLALSYDHRLVDGRESVSFLVRLKEMLEDPTRLILEI